MSMFTKLNGLNPNSIRARVIAAMELKIENAEKEYETRCEEIDQEATRQKDLCANQLVQEII